MNQGEKLTIWQDICSSIEDRKMDVAYMIFSNTIDELSDFKKNMSEVNDGN